MEIQLTISDVLFDTVKDCVFTENGDRLNDSGMGFIGPWVVTYSGFVLDTNLELQSTKGDLLDANPVGVTIEMDSQIILIPWNSVRYILPVDPKDPECVDD